MASKFEIKQPDFKRLKAALVTSGLQQKDNALYQVINGLLDSITRSRDLLKESVDELETTSSTLSELDTYDVGNLIVSDGHFKIHVKQVRLVGFNQLSLEGDSRFMLVG